MVVSFLSNENRYCNFNFNIDNYMWFLFEIEKGRNFNWLNFTKFKRYGSTIASNFEFVHLAKHFPLVRSLFFFLPISMADGSRASQWNGSSRERLKKTQSVEFNMTNSIEPCCDRKRLLNEDSIKRILACEFNIMIFA